jgi:hypothetical protein
VEAETPEQTSHLIPYLGLSFLKETNAIKHFATTQLLKSKIADDTVPLNQ